MRRKGSGLRDSRLGRLMNFRRRISNSQGRKAGVVKPATRGGKSPRGDPRGRTLHGRISVRKKTEKDHAIVAEKRRKRGKNISCHKRRPNGKRSSKVESIRKSKSEKKTAQPLDSGSGEGRKYMSERQKRKLQLAARRSQANEGRYMGPAG